MRILILITLFIASTSALCQPIFVTDTSSAGIDSIFNRLKSAVAEVRQYHTDVTPLSKTYRTVVRKYAKDSSVYLFSDTMGRLLFKTIDKYNKSGFRSWQSIEVYSLTGQLYYREGWKWNYRRPGEKIEDDYIFIDAWMAEKRRFTYDSLGRISTENWWYAPIRLLEYRYTYSNSDTLVTTIRKDSIDLFWK
ncbi:hypothetical protein [Paraflavitalea sp. CAU 1676]|uniref:hypothetical protein n=1 Tax=Paraflavitalea sp. CAU 1676 TaxID=3032598 RepID=UPI0023DBBC26|nr:hypothetical protein [Paraflavitalea sp. CAU 1676]MDF2188379.1 hypothetical protein [Paraflavitalea sp. CAU 1676]